MIVSKSKGKEFLLFRYGTIEKRALFEREVLVLFEEFKKWYKENYWDKSPVGVTLKVFTDWLKKYDIIVARPRRSRRRYEHKR